MKVSILLHYKDKSEERSEDTEIQPERESFPGPEISPVAPTLPPSQAPFIKVTEVATALTATPGLDDVALSVVGEAESLHENQLPIGYQVITNIPVIGRVYQQQCCGVD